MNVLLLDAMGVIYQARDDVAELLVPFVRDSGSNASAAAIEEAYIKASLGRLTAEDFWRAVGVAPEREDSYLRLHRVDTALSGILEWAAVRFDGVSCLSNDVSEWSAKLRHRHGLEDRIAPWFISGDLGYRKPSREIYDAVLARWGRAPEEFVFVDDRLKNLDAASEIGFRTVWIDHDNAGGGGRHTTITGLNQLPQAVAGLA